MEATKKRKKGQPSKKMRRAANKLSIRNTQYLTMVAADTVNGGLGFKKPGNMKMC